MKKPLVSVIIPVFNRANLIKETLDSVIKQTYINWECIVVDDGSTDGTIEVLKQYANKDSRINWYKRPKFKIKGASTCRNIGFELSKGKLIQYLDSDDLISENKFECQVNLLKNTNFKTFSTCKWGWLKKDKKGEILRDLSIYKNFEKINLFLDALSVSRGYAPIHNYMFHRKLILENGNWNEYLKINDDGEFMARIFVNSNQIEFSGKCNVLYRIEDKSSLSTLNSSDKMKDLIYSWKIIESLLNIRFGNKIDLFINSNKKMLFSILSLKNIKIISDNKSFFKSQIKSSSLLIKLKLIFISK